MTYRPRRSCKRCGRDRDVCGGLSRRGNCRDCGKRAMLANLAALREHQGIYWDHWLDRNAEWVARLYGAGLPPETEIGPVEAGLTREDTS